MKVRFSWLSKSGGLFLLSSKKCPLQRNTMSLKEFLRIFLAKLDGKPVGTARWRFTNYGVKMERFAVVKEARGRGVGQALVEAVLEDVDSNPDAAGKTKYLHSQLTAISLYSKFGFEKVGEMFEECNIQHYKMELA